MEKNGPDIVPCGTPLLTSWKTNLERGTASRRLFTQLGITSTSHCQGQFRTTWTIVN